jgi:hypothetical protein
VRIKDCTKEAKTKELNIIQDTLHNNKYNKNLSMIHSKPDKQNKNTGLQPHPQKTKWSILIYSGEETKKTTKLFKEAEIKVAFRTRNTIQNTVNPHPQTDKYEKSDVYQMKCTDCALKYMEQTGRTFHTRYKEYIHAIRNNNGNSGYSNHILNTGHASGNITGTMKIVKIDNKGKHLNTLEKYHIYNE